MSPAPERSRRINALYRRALECTPQECAVFLDKACAGDAKLRAEVEALLAEDVTRTTVHDDPAAFLSGQTTAVSDPARRSPDSDIANTRFRVIRRIGEGGMGIVFEVWDEERGVRTALKTLTGFHPDALYLFKNEFRSLADISHPNLVALYELFSGSGQSFFTMEFVEGVHFLEFVKPSQQSPDPEFSRLRSTLGQLTQAVLALHAAGILHRDLKPANVKVTPEGRVVVLDFGLAAHRELSRFEDTTVRPGIFGTVPYMAPELVRGERVAEPADWYAVGMMAFEAITGRRPFEGAPSRVLEDKKTQEAPAAVNFEPNVPPDLNAICTGLLACDPARRMTGHQVLELLGMNSRETAAAHAPASRQPAGEGVFVGRDAQLAVLQDAFSVTSRGAPCAVFVHGKSGIGKSTLASRFLQSLAERGDVVILAGRCYEQESMPYKALDSAVDSLSRHLARLPRHEAAELTPRDAAALAQIFPVLRRVDSIADAPQRVGPALTQHEIRRRAFGALRELLARLGDRRRIVLYLNDLQWGDTDSARLLAEILRPPEAPALLMIGAYRTGNNLFLDEFLKNGAALPDLDIRDVPVAPLSTEHAGELAVALLSRFPGAAGAAEQIARESGGNPYFVQELIAASGAVDLEKNVRETSLDDALWSRVTELPTEARCVLEVIAVSGQPVDERLACEVAGTTRDPRLFGILRSARMIRGSVLGDRPQVEAWHDRLRETVVARLEPAVFKRYHYSLGEALESAGSTDPERVATHYEAAGEAQKAGRYYRAAAEAATATLAFKHAAGLFQKALDLLRPEGEEKLKLTILLAESLANAGHGLDAARQYQWASRAASGPEAAELERRCAYWFSVSGHVDEGREALEKLLLRAGVSTPTPRFLFPSVLLEELRVLMRGLRFRPRTEDSVPNDEIERVDALWDAAQSFAILDIPMAVFTTARQLRLALRTGERTRIARALTMATAGTSVLPVIGRSRSLTLLSHLEKLSRDAPPPYIQGALPFTRGFVDFCVEGRWEASLAGLREARQIFTEKSCAVPWEMSLICVLSLWNLQYLGRYAELTQLAATYARDGDERGDLCQATWIGALIQPFVEMSAGRPDQGLVLMDESLARWTRRKYSIQLATSAYVRAWILIYRGDNAAAWNFLHAEWPALRRNLYLHVNAIWQWLVYTRAQTALAATPEVLPLREALRVAEGDARRLERNRAAYSRPLAQLVRAGCAFQRHDPASAVRLLEAAAPGLDTSGMSMIAAAARRRLGELAGGETGHALVERADAAMRAEGVADPARLTNVFVNGFATLSAAKRSSQDRA